jgi:glycosyltransferase involved in cell wall biosynthesis
LPQIKKEWADQILLVDGQSTDATVQLAQSYGIQTYVQKKKGIRHAYIEAMPLVIGDVVLTMSPDGNCDVSRIPALLNRANWADLAIGSRYMGCKSEDDDLITGFGNWCFRQITRVLHGGLLRDPMVIYRAFRKELFYELDLHKEESYSLYERLFSTVISIEPLMTVRALKAGKRIWETGCGEPARIGGTRKLQIFRWGAAYLCQIIRESWYWKPA